MSARLGCAAALVALGLVIPGNAPPPPEPPPEPPARETPIIRPALQLDTMTPATVRTRSAQTACERSGRVVVDVGRA